MKMKILRFTIHASVVLYYTICMSIAYADERPHFQESSSSQYVDSRIESLGSLAVLPNDVITLEVLTCFDPEDDKVSLDRLMAVSKSVYRCVQDVYNSINNTFGHAPWQYCETLSPRNLFYTYSYMGKLVGLQMNWQMAHANTYGMGIDYLRFNSLCSTLSKSCLWTEETILWSYTKLLTLLPHKSSGQLYHQLTNTVRTIAAISILLSEGPKIPSEWLPFVHLIYLEREECWMEFLQKELVDKGLERIKGPLFAAFDSQLLSLKLAVKDMSKDDPQYCHTMDTIVSLEPMPAMWQLDHLVMTLETNGHYSKAAKICLKALNVRKSVGQEIHSNDYLYIADLWRKANNHVQAANYFIQGAVMSTSNIYNSQSGSGFYFIPRTTTYNVDFDLYNRACDSFLKAGDESYKSKQYAEAVNYYVRERDARKFLRQNVDAAHYKHVGDVCVMAGMDSLAGDFYADERRALTTAGQKVNSSHYRRGGDAYFKAERFSDAIHVYKEEATARRQEGIPLDADYFKRMGDAYFEDQKFDLAKNFYDKRIDALKKAGQPITEACLDAQKACEQSPTSVVKQQAEKYRQMAAPTSAPISAKARS